MVNEVDTIVEEILASRSMRSQFIVQVVYNIYYNSLNKLKNIQ